MKKVEICFCEHISIALKRGIVMVIIKNEFLTAKINQLGAELTNLSSDGNKILKGKSI